MLSGEVTLSKWFCLPSEKVSTLKGKNLLPIEFAPMGSKFFPFRVDSFSEGNWCAGMQKESHKSCFPCKIAENISCVSCHFDFL